MGVHWRRWVCCRQGARFLKLCGGACLRNSADRREKGDLVPACCGAPLILTCAAAGAACGFRASIGCTNGAVADAFHELPPNNRVNPTVGPVTSLATAASAAPVPPAGYARRWADEGVSP